MNRWWKEPLLLMLIGLASIGVVLSARQLLFRPSSQVSSSRSEGSNAVLRKQVEDSKEQIRRLEQRLKETEAKIETREQPKGSEETPLATEPRDTGHNSKLGPIVQSPILYQEALARAWQYLQAGKFDPVVHKEILEGLEEAYAVSGLPPEANANLVKAIERINDLGVSTVISESQTLPSENASKLLQAFLDTTPRLSVRQKAQIKAALRRRNR